MASFDSLLSSKPQHAGWFSTLYKNYRNRDSAALVIEEFAQLETDENRFEYIRNDKKAWDDILEEYALHSSKFKKCQSTAEKHRQAGNKAFQKGDFLFAFQLYTLGVKIHPQTDKEDFAIVIANRSAALYRLELFQEALSDIAWCLQIGYAKSMQYKVKDREARCLLALKQHLKALHSFRGTLQALDNADLPFERKRKWQMDVQIMMAMLEKTPKILNEPLINNLLPQLPTLTGGHHQALGSASANIGIRYEHSLGRYVIAEKACRTGDTLIVEKPSCAVLLAEHSDTHCFQCFKSCIASIPCPNCTAVLFCNFACLEIAMSTHHKYECPSLASLWNSGASITCLMALRLISQQSPNFWQHLDLILKQDECCPDSPERLLLFESGDYRAVNRLERHSDKRTHEDLLHRAIMSLVLFKCLEDGGYFKEISKEKSTFIGGLLLRNLQSLQFNAHEIFELEEPGSPEKEARTVFLGGGLYPTLALFNHSCEPSVTRYFVGSTIVARAIRPLRVGEQIGENYGPIFTQEKKEIRQKRLMNQYWFECKCRACLENWPLFDEMPNDVLRFRCEHCPATIVVGKETSDFMTKCSACNKLTNLLSGLKALQDTGNGFERGTRLIKGNNCTKALEEFILILELLDSTLVPPFKDYHLCQQAVRQCLLRYGNKIKKQ